MVNVGDLDYPGQPEEGLPSVCVCFGFNSLIYIYIYICVCGGHFCNVNGSFCCVSGLFVVCVVLYSSLILNI